MIVTELRRAIAALDLPVAKTSWDYRRLQLREKILAERSEPFLAWSVVNSTMFVGNAPWIDVEYQALPARFLEAIYDPGFGGPVMYNERLSGNYIHQAYHLLQWEQRTGRSVDSLGHIIEFGGGYGAMAVACRQLGFKGRYTLLDLPEFRELQRYYLSNTIGLDNIYLDAPYSFDCDLFIACHSLSEVDLETRYQLLMTNEAASYLFAFHCEHEGIDNLAWFTTLMGREFEWWQWMPQHLPNSRYQVGLKR